MSTRYYVIESASHGAEMNELKIVSAPFGGTVFDDSPQRMAGPFPQFRAAVQAAMELTVVDQPRENWTVWDTTHNPPRLVSGAMRYAWDGMHRVADTEAPRI